MAPITRFSHFESLSCPKLTWIEVSLRNVRVFFLSDFPFLNKQEDFHWCEVTFSDDHFAFQIAIRSIISSECVESKWVYPFLVKPNSLNPLYNQRNWIGQVIKLNPYFKPILNPILVVQYGKCSFGRNLSWKGNWYEILCKFRYKNGQNKIAKGKIWL